MIPCLWFQECQRNAHLHVGTLACCLLVFQWSSNQFLPSACSARETFMDGMQNSPLEIRFSEASLTWCAVIFSLFLAFMMIAASRQFMPCLLFSLALPCHVYGKPFVPKIRHPHGKPFVPKFRLMSLGRTTWLPCCFWVVNLLFHLSNHDCVIIIPNINHA